MLLVIKSLMQKTSKESPEVPNIIRKWLKQLKISSKMEIYLSHDKSLLQNGTVIMKTRLYNTDVNRWLPFITILQ